MLWKNPMLLPIIYPTQSIIRIETIISRLSLTRLSASLSSLGRKIANSYRPVINILNIIAVLENIPHKPKSSGE